MTVGGIAATFSERGGPLPNVDRRANRIQTMKVEASEEIRMERKNGNITTLMLGASTCSEGRLSRLMPHLRQATVTGCSALTLLILAFPAQGGLINGSFEMVDSSHTSSFAIANAT